MFEVKIDGTIKRTKMQIAGSSNIQLAVATMLHFFCTLHKACVSGIFCFVFVVVVYLCVFPKLNNANMVLPTKLANGSINHLTKATQVMPLHASVGKTVQGYLNMGALFFFINKTLGGCWRSSHSFYCVCGFVCLMLKVYVTFFVWFGKHTIFAVQKKLPTICSLGGAGRPARIPA